MSARIVNLANPDEDETLCATVEEAEKVLAAMVEKFRSQGYTVTEQVLPDEDYAQYKVIDLNDAWIGTYTIILE